MYFILTEPIDGEMKLKLNDLDFRIRELRFIESKYRKKFQFVRPIKLKIAECIPHMWKFLFHPISNTAAHRVYHINPTTQ